MKDYSITLRDSAGRIATLSIVGASILDLVKTGCSEEEAREEIERNALANAVYRNEIGEDCWMVDPLS